MRLNDDFSARVVVQPGDYLWVKSPSGGVERMMLDRIGEEVARATTIVRFAAGSHFDAHSHGGGEEFLVLDGVFSDETGDFPKGSYVRNPIGTRHTPFTEEGCTIFVKLHQFSSVDTTPVNIDLKSAEFHGGPSVSVAKLHRAGNEKVVAERWSPKTEVARRNYPGGAEIFVLEGGFSDDDGDYTEGSWLRLPPGFAHRPRSDQGCVLYIKTGHLDPVIGAEMQHGSVA
jgi:anti-sigma factor ChrR (cupin superfamily)